MGAVLGERGDDVPERGERLVDARRLAQPLAARACLALPLAARQVHQVQLAHAASAKYLHSSMILNAVTPTLS